MDITELSSTLQYYCMKCSGTYECHRNVKCQKNCQTCDLACQYRCRKCSTRFRSYAHARRHCFTIADCQSKTELCCNDCSFKTYIKQILAKHIKQVHTRAELNPKDNFKCDMCCKVFKCPYYLKWHQERLCVEHKNIKCEFCVYKSGVFQRLKRHVFCTHMKQSRDEAGSYIFTYFHRIIIPYAFYLGLFNEYLSGI